MSEATVTSAPTIPIAEINIEEGFNARTRQDPKKLEEMAASIGRLGIVQPVILRFDEEGKAWLVAGHRRIAAALKAGLTDIPYNLNAGQNRHEVALAENDQREDLDPIDLARAMKAIAEEHNLTQAALAKRVNRSTAWVGARLRLLGLPEGVQELVAEEVIPVEGEPLLRDVAKVSPRIAECICITAKRREVPKGSFVKVFDQLLPLTCAGDFPEPPTMIEASRATMSSLVGDPAEREALITRVVEVDPHATADPYVGLGDEDLDAARAAGCLLEHEVDKGGSFLSTLAYITDAEFAADLARRRVEQLEAASEKRAEEEAARREAAGSQPSTMTEEEEKESRATKRAEAKAKADAARIFNGEVGVRLLKRGTKTSRKHHALSRSKAVAAILLADNPELPASGLPLVFSQLQEVEVKTLKSKETRERVDYADKGQALAFVERQIDEAKSAEEVLEILANAFIAAVVADQDELPQSRRIGWWSHAQNSVAKLLAEDIKEVKPTRRRKK